MYMLIHRSIDLYIYRVNPISASVVVIGGQISISISVCVILLLLKRRAVSPPVLVPPRDGRSWYTYRQIDSITIDIGRQTDRLI